jgi:hypothetical protein
MLTSCCLCQGSEGASVGTLVRPVEQTVLGAWCSAGIRYGALIGATFGALFTLVVGAWFVVYLGVLVGGIIGSLVGVAVGAANGIALTLLATSRAWNASMQQRSHRAACAAIATTVLTVVSLQLVLFRSVTNQAELLFLDVPMSIGAAAAAHPTRRLTPVA